MNASRPAPGTPWRYLLWLAWLLVWMLTAVAIAAVAAWVAFDVHGAMALAAAGVTGLVSGGLTFAGGQSDRADARAAAKLAGWSFVGTVVCTGLWALVGVLAAALVLAALLVTCPTVVGPARAAWRRRWGHAPRPPGVHRSVYGPAALLSANDADLAARQHTRPGHAAGVLPDAVGSIDMTAFEVALLHAEELESATEDHAEAECSAAVPAQPEPGESTEGGLRGLDLDELCRMWRRSTVLLHQGLSAQELTAVLLTRQRCLDELMRRHPVGTRAWMASGRGLGDDPRPFLMTEPETR